DALSRAADADVRLAGGEHGELAVVQVEGRELLGGEDPGYPPDRVAAAVRPGEREPAQRLRREAGERLFRSSPGPLRATLGERVELRAERLRREPPVRREVQPARPRRGREERGLGRGGTRERARLAAEALAVELGDGLRLGGGRRQKDEAGARRPGAVPSG